MKATVTSTFHQYVFESFSGLHTGVNYRRIKRNCGTNCRCGYPTHNVEWSIDGNHSIKAERSPNNNEVCIIID